MLDVGVFIRLNQYFSTKETAYILAFTNLMLCIIALMFANKRQHRKEMGALAEIRDYTRIEMTNELESTKKDMLEMDNFLKHVMQDISSVFSLSSLVPLLKKMLKHK